MHRAIRIVVGVTIVLLSVASAPIHGQPADGDEATSPAQIPRQPLAARLDRALRTALPPEEHGWLWKEPGTEGYADCPDAAYEAVRRAARQARETRGEERYAWLLAADRRAAEDCGRWFGFRADSSDGLERRRRRLGELGLRYAYDELGADWVYQRNLLRRVWDEAPDTRWGQFAFALLQATGWDTSGTCSGGSEQFAPVIEKGELFLARREPESFLEAVVKTTVAQAHETKWSLSRTHADDLGLFGYVVGSDASQEQRERVADWARSLVGEDGREARRRALELYRSVHGSPAAGERLRAYAATKIRQLEAGENTRQYRYYCMYD